MEIPLRLLFETRSLAELAAALAAGESVPGRSERLAQLLLRVRRMPAAELGEALALARLAGGAAFDRERPDAVSAAGRREPRGMKDQPWQLKT